MSYELHHIGQKADSPLAILTKDRHISNGNKTILHPQEGTSQIYRPDFESQKDEFWLDLLQQAKGGL